MYDVLGRRVRTLIEGRVAFGQHSIPWDGRDDIGRQVASGVYVYQLRIGAAAEAGKIVLLK